MFIFYCIFGVILFFGIVVLLFVFDKLLSLEEGFEQVKVCLISFLVKLVIWGLLFVLLYYLVVGVCYLVMDVGVGEMLEGGKCGFKIVIVIVVVLIVLVGVWVW